MFLSPLVFLNSGALDFLCDDRGNGAVFYSVQRLELEKDARVERLQNQIIVNLKNCGLLRHEQMKNWDFGDDTSKSVGRIKIKIVPIFPHFVI